jgi:uncharacterized OB-fold protein
MCPHCWSPDFEWIEARRSGTVVSFTLVQRPIHDVFADEAPVVLAEIEMPEGFSLLARVMCDDPSMLATGRTVSLVRADCAAKYPLPTFTLS